MARVIWFGDRAMGMIAVAAAVVAAVGLAVTIVYVLPRATGPSHAAGGTTSPGNATTTTFSATADTYVEPNTANHGKSNRMVVDASPERHSLLAFSVTGLTGTVTRALLRLHTVADNTGSESGGTWRAMTDATWDETAVTWADQPVIDGATVGVIGPVTSSEWYEIDVTSEITGNGSYAFAGTSASNDDAYFETREAGATAPQLVVTTLGGSG